MSSYINDLCQLRYLFIENVLQLYTMCLSIKPAISSISVNMFLRVLEKGDEKHCVESVRNPEMVLPSHILLRICLPCLFSQSADYHLVSDALVQHLLPSQLGCQLHAVV